MRPTLFYKRAFLALIFILTSVHASSADESDPSGAPLQINGFSYQYIPRGGVHMNICKHTSCGLGSKVSYVVYAPDGPPDFSEFKRAQKKIGNLIKAAAKKGTTVNVGRPKRKRDERFTVFTNYRILTSASGKKMYTKSTMVHGDKITYSIITTADNKKKADANGALFLLGLMTWGEEGSFETKTGS